MSEHVIEFDCECESCKGTGVYVDLAERNGLAVVCHTCEGSGEVHRKITYRDFEGRKKRTDVQRVVQAKPDVVQANPGIAVGTGIERNGKTEYELSDFGGLPYGQWLEGAPFPKGSEMRRFTCPAWWYQTADCDKKPDWRDGEVVCRGIGSFSSCDHFCEKEKCWARWDRENPREED